MAVAVFFGWPSIFSWICDAWIQNTWSGHTFKLKLPFVISFQIKNNSTLGQKTDDKPEGHGAPTEASFVFGQNMRDRAKVWFIWVWCSLCDFCLFPIRAGLYIGYLQYKFLQVLISYLFIYLVSLSFLDLNMKAFRQHLLFKQKKK